MRQHRARPEAEMPPEFGLIHEYLTYGAITHADRLALASEERDWTYAEAREEIDRIARALIAAGVQKGDRVAVLLPPCPLYFLTFLATASIGAIWVGLNPKYSKRELAHPISDCRPCLILARMKIGDRDYCEDLKEICGDARLIELDEGGAARFDALLGAGDMISPDLLAKTRHAVRPEDACLIVYTSGTSGAPKGAMLTHQGLTYCGRTDAKYNLDSDGQVMLCNFPINHIACVGDICCTTLIVGGTIVFMETFDPAGIVDVIERREVTHLGQIPVMLHMTLEHPEFDPAKLRSLRQIFWGGNPASIDLVERLRAICPNLSNVYGMTETTGNVLFARGEDFSDEELAGSVGIAPPEYEVDLFDESGAKTQDGHVGEIHVRGPFLMAGYWENDAATAATFTSDGWLKTGDLAKRDEKGLISIVGRRSEMYKSGGYNVYPAEVEQAIESHDGVGMVAVVGVPDKTYFEVGHAYILARSDNLTREEIISHCKGLLANYKIPKAFHIVDDLPLLPNGKIDKKALLAKAKPTTIEASN